MSKPTSIALSAIALFATAGVAEALAVIVPAKDPSPAVITRPTLVHRDDIIKIREKADGYPDTKVRFKVYPETYGYRATSPGCQGRPFYFTPYRRTNVNGVVVIRLNPPKPWCRGVMYQAEALLG